MCPGRRVPDAVTRHSAIGLVALGVLVHVPTADASVPTTSTAADLVAMLDAGDGLGEGVRLPVSSGGPTTSLYGFSDFTLSKTFLSADNPFRALIETPATFYVGNLNVYFENTFEAFRSLVEVRFLYEPNGATTDLGANYQQTTAADHADLFRRFRWGAIEIERAWAEYAIDPRLVLRVGQWLTPYGIWNVDHGSPTLIAVRRPYTIGDELFPERQTGIQVHGVVALGASDLSYALTLSNGRGPFDSYLDLDDNKAVGGRIALRDYSWADLAWGVSAFYGRFTSLDREIEIRDDPIFVATRTIATQFDELSIATDLRLRVDDLLVQVEVIGNQRTYTEEGRPRVALSPNAVLVPDDWTWGAYALFAVETPWLSMTPYIIVELTQQRINPLGIDAANAIYLGLNWRVIPQLTVKVQGTYISFMGDSAFGRSRVEAFDTQVAWSF